MAQSVQLQKLSPKHEAIMNWILENPERSRRECAAHFNVTETWLSIVVNSNCFQARLAEKQEVIFSVVASDIPTKLRGAAAIAIERVTELLPGAPGDYALDAMDKTLRHLGFGAPKSGPVAAGPQGTVNVQQNFYSASPKELAEARDMMQRVGAGAVPQGALIDATAEPASQT